MRAAVTFGAEAYCGPAKRFSCLTGQGLVRIIGGNQSPEALGAGGGRGLPPDPPPIEQEICPFSCSVRLRTSMLWLQEAISLSCHLNIANAAIKVQMYQKAIDNCNKVCTADRSSHPLPEATGRGQSCCTCSPALNQTAAMPRNHHYLSALKTFTQHHHSVLLLSTICLHRHFVLSLCTVARYRHSVLSFYSIALLPSLFFVTLFHHSFPSVCTVSLCRHSRTGTLHHHFVLPLYIYRLRTK